MKVWLVSGWDGDNTIFSSKTKAESEYRNRQNMVNHPTLDYKEGNITISSYYDIELKQLYALTMEELEVIE